MSRTSRSQGIQNSVGPHAASILLALLSARLLFLVILYNVPLSSEHTIASDPGARMWLVRLSSRGIEYGLGVWGWCQWRYTGAGAGAGSGEDVRAVCTRHAFWKLPDDAERGDPIRDFNLPSTLATSLSISSFFLIFVLYLSLDLTFFLLLSLRFHSPTQPARSGPLYCIRPKTLRFRTWVAYTLRNAYMRVAACVAILAWGLPVVLIAAVGAGELDDGVEGRLGAGWGMTLAALIMLLIVQFLILAGGLWNDPTRSGKKH